MTQARMLVAALLVASAAVRCTWPALHTATTLPSAPRARDISVAGGRLRYGLHLQPQPNLIYQLDCIASAIVCARSTYRDLWSTLGLDATDEAVLADWKALRTRHRGQLRRVDRPSPVLPLLVADDVAELGERQRIASLVSRTPAEYQTAVALVSSDGDARELRRILARFEPRFANWWRRTGFTAGAASCVGFARLLVDPFFDKTITQALRFYQAELPTSAAVEIYVMVQPAAARGLITAEELEGYAVVGTPAGEDPALYVDVVAHELFHYFFSRMQPMAR